jgi:basic membrane protein A and related proteins
MQNLSRRSFNRGIVSALACAASGASLAFPIAAAIPNRPIRVALLLSGVVTDGGWSQLAFDGLQDLNAQGGFKTAYAENITLAQMDQVTRGYSDDGFDLIIGHGVEFSSTLLEVAPDYPKQRYFVTTFRPQSPVPPNLMYVNMGYWGAAYGAGALAALLSQRRTVGFIGGNDDPNQQNMKKAFTTGVERTVPGTRALAIITGDYDNAAKGREAASILIGNGADVLWHAADVTGLGAIQGAVAGNVKILGCYSDQTALAPNNMVTSFVMNLRGMVSIISHAAADGTFAGGAELTLREDQMWLLRNGANGDHNSRLVSPDVWNAFQKIWVDLAAGRINATVLAS